MKVKYCVVFLLILGIIPLMIEDTAFLKSSAVLMITSVGMLLTRKRREDVKFDYIRYSLVKILTGDVGSSIYGIILFVILAMALTTWLPDGIEEKNYPLIAGTVFYLVAFFALFLWASPSKKEKPKGFRQTRVLIMALSKPNWSIEDLKKATCEDLLHNRKRLNVNPIFIAVNKHRSEIKKLILIVSKEIVTNRDYAERIKAIADKLKECFSREIEIEEWLIDDANDLNRIRGDLLPKLERIIREESAEEITIDITGGTAAISGALTLLAVKEDIQAQYLRQDRLEIQKIDIDVFDLGDLWREFSERLMEKTS
ncbi:hypothetical protein [Thermococcus barophilus]|uniref:CRISPR-associated protein n=1 Tax=Thermococcus barophilus TaxID=55802 RepID=A0A0S1XEY0_THEBA|nr:hypothetical protein [Thermococcus barophilus]ALM76256.1 membrane hypothetical protein [Thermococcus barophilus]